MRIGMFSANFCALGSFIVLTGCATEPTSVLNYQNSKLNFERSQSALKPTMVAVDSKTIVTLENSEARTPRRIEHIAERPTTSTRAPEDVMVQSAFDAAEKLFPNTELKVTSVDMAPFFTYVSFQQISEGRDVVGAQLTLQLTSQADWLTANSSLISPKDIPQIDGAAGRVTLDSQNFITEAHRVYGGSQRIF